MPDGAPYRAELAEAAARDFDEIIDWTARRFGGDAALRYSDLIAQAFQDLERDPFRIESHAIAGPLHGLRSYHLGYSRKRVRSFLGHGRKPRHFIVYRVDGRIVHILRLVHDIRELERPIRDID